MKKLMLVAAVAAMAFGAKADYSCGLSTSYLVAAKGDENPNTSVVRSGYYQVYIIQNAGADVNAVADYVKGKTVAQIASEATVTYDFAKGNSTYSHGQYYYSYADASRSIGIDINPYQAYFVSFYGETPTEFCVVANHPTKAELNTLYYDDETNATSGWQSYTAPGPAPIPEPTSGLLLLIGVAGLALKRKRA